MRGGGGRSGASQVLPLQKGGAVKVLAMLKGGLEGGGKKNEVVLSRGT